MTSTRILCVGLIATALMSAAIIDTTDAGTIAAFQTGATVVSFESIGGITPMAITAYTDGVPATLGSTLFNEVPGVQFSVGGNPGSPETEPIVLQLGGGIAGDAASATNVLGSADMAGNTKFSGFIEIYFPVKVDRVGFWLNPALGTVTIIAKDNQTAFSGDPTENQLETLVSTAAGNFVGIQRATADIGGVTLLPSAAGITIDDLTFLASTPDTPIPEPGTLGLCLVASLVAWAARRKPLC